ncbi:MAG: endonuclease/exonuclease/phosphatase family protein [Saprospiraceae bacterium]|nr:endonuclease/exonuclease/phosphatase family protein [Saprospiraceae bacterium]
MARPGRILGLIVGLMICISNLPAQIFIDGNFEDWDDVPVFLQDPIGDVSGTNVDFGKLKIFDTEDFIFFYLETGFEINLQDGQNIQMVLDTDDNPATGIRVRDLGAELVYNFGNRSGNAFLNGNTYTISHPDVGLVSLPTVSSTVFEIAIRKRISIGGTPVFGSGGCRVLFRNGPNGDYLEENSEAKYYTFSGLASAEVPAYSIKKKQAGHLRIMSYNVERDGLLGNVSIGRMLQATSPDIIGFQEIYNTSLSSVKQQIETWLPNSTWYISKAGPDCILVSKYQITATESLEYGGSGSSGNGAFLLEDPALGNRKYLIVNAHLPCCDNNTNRQEEVDGIMSFIRDCREGEGPFELPQESPIFILGDMNLVGYARQLTTFYEGDILDNNTYGPDFGPDTDGSDLLDCGAFASGTPLAFTWNDGGSSFSPGKLDYIFYTDNSVQLANAFGLETEELPADSLNQYNLELLDSRNGADHIPVIADFVLDGSTGFFEPVKRTPEIFGYPNPGRGNLIFTMPEGMTGATSIEVRNFSNQSLVDKKEVEIEDGKIQIDSSTWSGGVYILEFSNKNKKFISRQIIK